MSYLSTPRLHFAGQFQADPPTVNNDPQHFDSATFRSNYQIPGPGATNGWWNPRGSGAWRFRDCTVTRVVYSDGTHCDDPNVDPVVGAAVNDTDQRVEGKLVDLDPEQQMVSQIWGFQVVLTPALEGLGGGPQFGFRSDFAMAPFADLWARFPKGQPDSFFGAFYQSVLAITKWFGAKNSRFLQELLPTPPKEGEPLPKLSIKFLVDGYNDDRSAAAFTFGRVVGTIGPWNPGEPEHFVAGRALWQTPGSPLGATAYAAVANNIITLDLGNSLPTQAAGGAIADQGNLWLAALPASGAPVLIGEISYHAPRWYERTAGLVSFQLSDTQAAAVASSPLAVVQTGLSGPQPLLLEASTGVFVRADQFVFRLNPGDATAATFYATKFGQPVAQQIALAYDASIMAGQTDQGPVPGPATVGEPQSACTFPLTVTTGANGQASLPIQAADPGHPRQYIDGQLYGVVYAPGDQAPPVGTVQNPSQILNVLVWSGYTIPETPTWMRDVQPVLQQYANLYPVMLPIVNLGNYASVMSRRAIMQNVFEPQLPMADPNYMPVTRDMSRAKRTMVHRWLKCPHYMQLGSKGDLLLALQQAVELEHSTIPPYLCGLYSIKPGANPEIAEIIRSVVVEEMLHMALVSNLLVSLGGHPRIGHPTFVPRYPGSLPGGLRGSLIVRLRRCSIEQIRDVFMSIEQPDKTYVPENGVIDPSDPEQRSHFTIGWFYDEIARALKILHAEGKIEFGHADRQVSEWSGPGKLIVITSLADALAAIDEIKDQGEGSSAANPDDQDDELAHYYKFAEIVAGKQLVKTEQGFAYTGPVIPFDPNGVWPMMDDPDYAVYPKGSRAQILASNFASTYQALLNGLHETFNGNPGYLKQAIGQMYSLSVIARELMQTPSGRNDGTTAGPTFQLPTPL